MTPQLYKKTEDCCGCKACANVCPHDAISFRLDEYGFQYPVIDDDKCIGCNRCVKTCDFQRKGNFGNYPMAGYAARHKSFAVYSRSTSGGAFTALAEWVIERGGIVYGCVLDESMHPVHQSAESTEELAKMRGSKYVQSDVKFIYREVKDKLNEGRLVLFSGTPCQIAGLIAFLGKTDMSRLLTTDLVCHGVPSALTFHKYLELLQQKYHSKIRSFQFRNKRYEWERPVISVGLDNGKEKWWFTTEDIYYENFNKGNFQRPSCNHCKYACEYRCGDITIGDFWGYQKADIKMSVIEGISCCLINTQKAKDIFGSLNLNVEEIDPSIIIQGNYHLRKPSTKGRRWESVMNEIRDHGFETLASEFKRNNRMAFFKAFIKKIVLRKM